MKNDDPLSITAVINVAAPISIGIGDGLPIYFCHDFVSFPTFQAFKFQFNIFLIRYESYLGLYKTDWPFKDTIVVLTKIRPVFWFSKNVSNKAKLQVLFILSEFTFETLNQSSIQPRKF